MIFHLSFSYSSSILFCDNTKKVAKELSVTTKYPMIKNNPNQKYDEIIRIQSLVVTECDDLLYICVLDAL